jgi:hypothetical protein
MRKALDSIAINAVDLRQRRHYALFQLAAENKREISVKVLSET